MTNNLYEVITTIVAGGLLGTLGQGIRMAIGLKKLSDTNALKSDVDKTDVNGTRLLLSLFIGFVAGALFLLVKGVDDINNKEFLFSVIAAGYSGADFIEGFFNTQVAKIGAASGATAKTVVTATAPLDTTPASFPSEERDDEPTTNL
ncbi:hypothetical protein [Flavobacterium mekongense]|uniref:hypothetical protein n=1 Tax=Flavobacterium mekongense TaxID=3379707 RepID=UPI00399BCDA6